MSTPGEKTRYQKGVNKDLDLRFEKFLKKRLQQGLAAVDALTDEEIDLMAQLCKKERLRYYHLSFYDVSKLVKFATRIEECRLRQKREKTRVRVERWRQKKVETEKSKVTKGTRRVKASRKTKKVRSIRQRRRKRVKSGAKKKSKKKRCVRQTKGK